MTMVHAADAMKARENLNGTVIDGRKIEVNTVTVCFVWGVKFAKAQINGSATRSVGWLGFV